jgi:hypothetical protein
MILCRRLRFTTCPLYNLLLLHTKAGGDEDLQTSPPPLKRNTKENMDDSLNKPLNFLRERYTSLEEKYYI